MPGRTLFDITMSCRAIVDADDDSDSPRRSRCHHYFETLFAVAVTTIAKVFFAEAYSARDDVSNFGTRSKEQWLTYYCCAGKS